MSLKISVVTVCYNAVDTLEETMLSVLNQTYPNVEYIVIDGSSTDGTVDIIKKYADRLAYWVSEPDKGIYDAMNKGIAVATGDYINFMNAGDMFFDLTTIEKIFLLFRHADATFIFGNWIESLHSENVNKLALSLDFLKHGMPCPHQAVFIKLNYHKIHPYNLEYKISADYNLLYNAYFTGQKFVYSNTFVAIYDMSPEKSISLLNTRLQIKEHLIIQGIHNRLVLNILTFCNVLKVRIKDVIKKNLPNRITILVKQYLNHIQERPVS